MSKEKLKSPQPRMTGSKEKVKSEREKLRSEREKKTEEQLNRKLVDNETLTEYESREIVDYEGNVYFTGLTKSAKEDAPVSWKSGEPYEGDNGFYKAKVGDHIAYRYEIMRITGIGSFAQVFKVKDWKYNGHLTAIKIVKKDCYEPLIEREVKVLKYLKKGDPDGRQNTVILIKDFYFRNFYCLAFEILYTNLYNVLRCGEFHGLGPEPVRKLACRMLKGLEYLDVMGVVHADLKPENIMLKEAKHSKLKMIDFGWSWLIDDEPMLSDYFQSRFYRAPEVILKGPITPAVDMWSYGCILAELASGYPLFPGENRHDQLSLIIEVLGLPPTHVLEHCARRYKYFSEDGDPFYCKVWHHSVYQCPQPGMICADTAYRSRALSGKETKKGDYRGVPGSKHIRAAMLEKETEPYDDTFIDFLLRCLTWDPIARMTPSEAIYHKWVADVYKSIT